MRKYHTLLFFRVYKFVGKRILKREVKRNVKIDDETEGEENHDEETVGGKRLTISRSNESQSRGKKGKKDPEHPISVDIVTAAQTQALNPPIPVPVAVGQGMFSIIF